MRKYIILSLALAVATLSSCSLDPTLADNASTDVKTVQTLRQLMNGAYSDMADYRYMGRDFEIAGEVRADNVFANGSSGRFTVMSRMNLLETSGDVDDMFRYMYGTLANPNIVINADLDKLDGNKDDLNQVVGEAYAMRAWVNFDLLRLFGQTYIDGGSNLGITYKKEFKGELQEARGSISDNKADIYSDIEKAIQYLTDGAASQWSANRTNLTLDAVYGLKTRVGIYFGGNEGYQAVRDAAPHVIGNYSLTPADQYVDYWASPEPGAASIFELAQSGTDNSGNNGLAYIYRGGSYGDIQCFDDLLDDADFDDNDVRASDDMIGMEGDKLRNLGKYPSMGTDLGTDNIKVMRYSEIVLNYAEALMDTDPSQALDLLNSVAEHRDADTYSEVNMDNILEERRKELIFEGFRFFDLARTGREIRDIDPSTVNNHGVIEPGSYKFAMPIPRQEIDQNDATEQNPGY